MYLCAGTNGGGRMRETADRAAAESSMEIRPVRRICCAAVLTQYASLIPSGAGIHTGAAAAVAAAAAAADATDSTTMSDAGGLSVRSVAAERAAAEAAQSASQPEAGEAALRAVGGATHSDATEDEATAAAAPKGIDR